MSAITEDQALTIREARSEDVDAIVALVESTYRGATSKQGWTTEADMLDGQRTDSAAVSALIDKSDSRVLLAERGGRLIACCHVEKQVESQGKGTAETPVECKAKVGEGEDVPVAAGKKVGYFGMFSVTPGLQSAGIGSTLLAQAERIVREDWHCAVMEMVVIDIRDELIAWYERRGYRRTGIKKPFPLTDERFGIPKRGDLRFEILAKSLI